MGDLAGLFGDLRNAFLEKDALDRLALAIGIVFPIASAAGTLTWVVVRRLLRDEVDALERKLKAAEDQLKVRTGERNAAREEARLRTADLAEVSPAAWVAIAGKERADGNDLRAVETLRTGFERVAPDLRTTVLELAWDQLGRGGEDRPHHFAEAWRLSDIAKALAEGDDVAELRDSLLEIDAGISQWTGRYDPEDPKWDVFEHARALDDPAVADAAVEELFRRIFAAIRAGRYWETERLARRAESVARRAAGPDSPRALTARYYHAFSSRLLGRYEEALAAVDALLPIEERVKGSEAPDILTTRTLRAYVLRDLDRSEEALAALDALLPVRESVSGSEHPDTLTTRSLRADILRGLGRFKEALAAVDAVLPVREKVSGSKHPDTLATRNLRIQVLHGLGRNEEALAAVEALLSVRENVLGPEHPHTLATRSLRAQVLLRLGRVEEALKLVDELMPVFERVMGPEHPRTLVTRHIGAQVLRELGRYEEALGEARAVLDARRRVLPAGNKRTSETETLIGEIETAMAADVDRRNEELDD